MKTFVDICKMTQPEVKDYMKRYLASKKYNVVDQDGFLYAKGTIPVLLVAHMDTVHKQQCKSIVDMDGKMSSPQGIGGDDRCGVFIIMNLVKELNCSVLLCEDEEIGCVGAHKFVKAEEEYTDKNDEPAKRKYIENLGVNYMIEFDRKGSNDAVFYHGDNEDFIDFVEDITNFKFASGSVSDISVLMEPASLSAVNLSCGYYNAHMPSEYVMYDEMMDTIEAARALINTECDKPFVYVKKKYTPAINYGRYPSYYSAPNMRSYYNSVDEGDFYGNFLDASSAYSDEPLARVAMGDKDLELEAIVYDKNLSEEVLHASGETKAECWMTLFLGHPNLCFNDIVDYSWG